MVQKRCIARACSLSVVLVSTLACNLVETGPTTEPASENDLAVCDAYQHLVDVWPADSEAVRSAGSAQEIYQAVEDAGVALSTAGLSADDPELGQVGERVGNAAVQAIQYSDELREIGWIDFFDESLIGGEALSQLCLEMGRPDSLPDESEVRQPAEGEDLEAFWDEFDWTDLTPAEQALWGLLGWDEASWQGEADEPASESKAWSELTNEQRSAAEQLGYDETYW